MADIVILVRGLGAVDEGDDVAYSCIARCSGMNNQVASIEFEATAAQGALATTVNTAIKNAAVTAAGVAGYTVGALDKKMILGGAVGV